MLKISEEITVTQMPLYRRSIRIYELLRKLIEQHTQNTSLKELYVSENTENQLLEKMVVDSIGLPPRIAIAHTTPSIQNRIRTVLMIQNTTNKLLRYCTILQENNRTNYHLIKTIRKELKIFGNMQKQWGIFITQQN